MTVGELKVALAGVDDALETNVYDYTYDIVYELTTAKVVEPVYREKETFVITIEDKSLLQMAQRLRLKHDH